MVDKEKRKERNKRYYEKMKSRQYTPSERDIAEKKRIEREEHRKLCVHFGTTNEDCLLFRRIHEKKEEHGFEIKTEFVQLYINHAQSCVSCGLWAKGDRDDLNANKGKKYENDELKGYEEVFKPKPSGFPEDYVTAPDGTAFPMNRICPNCGSELDDKGKCPNCDY